MNKFFIVIVAILLLLIFLMILKILKGPSIYDKMNGMSVLNAQVILLIVIFGFMDGRPEMYIDIAIAYGILGFVSNIIVAKYLRGKKGGKKDD